MQSNLLTFTKPSVWRRSFNLALGGRPVGTMKWPSMRTCETVLYDETFVFRREGMMWNQVSVVRREFEVSYAISDEARFKFPMGKRSLSVVMDDVTWHLKANFWRSQWHWEDNNGVQVIDYDMNGFTSNGGAIIAPSFLGTPDALLLAALGWYLICEIREASAAGAA